MVSVIVPVYQMEKYVERCIKSLLNQSYNNLEIILLDDGSTDNGLQICKQWEKKDKRIRVFDHSNQGVSYTRNQGIEKSTGEYLIFLDADDILHPDTIGSMVECIENERADVCICGYSVVSETDRKCFKPNIQGNIDLNTFKEDYFWDFYNKYILHNIGTKMYRKSWILSNNIRFKEKYAIYEDIIFCLEYLKNVRNIAVLDQDCYFYMKDNENSVTKSYRKEFLDNAFQLNEILAEMISKRTEEFYYNILKNIFIPYVNVYMKDKLKWDFIKKITRKVCENRFVIESRDKISLHTIPADERIFYYIVWRKNYFLIYMYGIWKRIRRMGVRKYAKKSIQ